MKGITTMFNDKAYSTQVDKIEQYKPRKRTTFTAIVRIEGFETYEQAQQAAETSVSALGMIG